MKKIQIDEDYFDDDENIYSEEVREMLLEDGEMTPKEAAFMRGYEGAG